MIDNKKSAAEKRRVYSEVVSGARDFVLVSLLMYLSSVAGVGHLPANTIISISLSETPLQSLVVRSSSVYQSATNMASITFGRIYVQPMANIAVIDQPSQGSPYFFLMEWWARSVAPLGKVYFQCADLAQ